MSENDNTPKKTRRPRRVTVGSVLAKCIVELDKLDDDGRRKAMQIIGTYYSDDVSSDSSSNTACDS